MFRPNPWSWITWSNSSWEIDNCLQCWANSQNDNYFHSKRQPRTILRENSCHFVNLLSFASRSFSLSMRKITWLNCQQPKTRGHVEHLILFEICPLIMRSLVFNLSQIFQITSFGKSSSVKGDILILFALDIFTFQSPNIFCSGFIDIDFWYFCQVLT